MQKGKAPKDDFVNDSSGPENEPKRKRKAGGDDGDGKRKKRRTKHKSKYVSVFIPCGFSVNLFPIIPSSMEKSDGHVQDVPMII